MFSEATVMNFSPSQRVLYCSGSGNSPCRGERWRRSEQEVGGRGGGVGGWAGRGSRASLTKSPSSLGTRTFISELLALMTSHWRESLLKYTWQPSVLLMEMEGTFPMTCVVRDDREKLAILSLNHS